MIEYIPAGTVETEIIVRGTPGPEGDIDDVDHGISLTYMDSGAVLYGSKRELIAALRCALNQVFSLPADPIDLAHDYYANND